MEYLRLPVGISDFKKLVHDNYIYIDKTLLIRDIMNDGAIAILIVRPRRFGKTMNMSMLKYFLALNNSHGDVMLPDQSIFKGLLIEQDKDFCLQYQNRFPVIYLTFKDVKKSTYENALQVIKGLFAELYEQFRYLLEGNLISKSQKKIFNLILDREADESILQMVIHNLSAYLYLKHQQKVVILIDEYDAPIQESYLATVSSGLDIKDKNSYYSQMIELMRGILGAALKDNIYLAKSVVTGITRISQESMFSGLNNIEIYSMLREEYGQYFGFTEEEVSLLVKYSNADTSMEKIKEWYDGYHVGKYELYNPWSIISCLKNRGTLQPYWLNTGGSGLIDLLIAKADNRVKAKFEQLLQSYEIKQSISEDLIFGDIGTEEDALWTLLIYAGYLNVISLELVGRRWIATISVPNKEVSFVYDKIVEQWFSRMSGLEDYDSFVAALANGDMVRFKNYLSTYLVQTASYYDFNQSTPENVFHIFVLGLVVGLRSYYHIKSNREAGLGRLDVVFNPKEKNRMAIVIEFKKAKTIEVLKDAANEGLQQIKDKQYVASSIGNSTDKILAIGLAFCGRQLEISHEIVQIS